MNKKIFIIILLSVFLSMSAKADQFNRYEVNESNKFNYSNIGKPATIELLIDFSDSMGWAVNITKKALEYILPQINGQKLGLRLFGGDLGIRPKECTPLSQHDPKTSFNIDCNANPSSARECRKLRQAIISNKPQWSSPYVCISCKQTKLVTPFGLNNQKVIIKGFDDGKISGITPIELGLKEAVSDLSSYRGRKKIILLTDGYENCGGDPCAYIKKVAANNKSIIIDVIIIGKNDNLKCLSEATGGKYYKVDDNTIIEALEKTFEVPKGTADKVRGYKFVDVDKVK